MYNWHSFYPHHKKDTSNTIIYHEHSYIVIYTAMIFITAVKFTVFLDKNTPSIILPEKFGCEFDIRTVNLPNSQLSKQVVRNTDTFYC